MTSISQQPVLPTQISSSASQTVAQVHSPSVPPSGKTTPQAAGTAPATARSYASATKKPFSPPAASGNIIPTVAVGGPASAQHGKSKSISPVNGKIVIPPAVPVVGIPSVANGNTANNISASGDHSRKPSVTISAAGASGYIPNGGPVVGKPTGGNGIQFGSMNTGGSPAMVNSIPQPNQSANSLAVHNPGNPRITSPQTSPSPIPQPPASGGRPPSSLHGQGNGLNFGSLPSEEAMRQMRTTAIPQNTLAPASYPGHLRRESSQSTHSDHSNPGMVPASGRGGYSQQSGRGKGYGPQYPQQMPYSPGSTYRNAPSQPRGGPNIGPQYQSQGRSLAHYQNSPHQAARSPALSSSQPVHPQPGQIPIANPQLYAQQYGGGYPQHMGPPQNQYGMPQGYYDPNYAAYYQTPAMQSPMHYMPPSSPRPPHLMPHASQQHYTPGQYGNPTQPPPMSRTPSAISVSDRPSSSTGPPQTAITTPAPSHAPPATRATSSPAAKSNDFKIPQRVPVRIKDPNSGAVKTFDKQPASPAPASRSPAIVTSTPTPPPRTPSHPDIQSHKTESKSVKTDEEKKHDMRDAIAKKIEADKAEEKRQKDEEESKAAEDKRQAEAKVLKDKEEAEEKEREAARIQLQAEEAAEKAKAEAEEAENAAAKAKEEAEKLQKEKEEEEEYARIEEEMQRKEAEAEERYMKKKQLEKEEQARKEAEAASKADEEMIKAEREAEEAEEARLKKLEESEGEDTKERVSLFAALRKEEPTTESSDSPIAVQTPVESGAATPVSDTSMGPPLRTASGGKQKPAALKLETSKAIEPPQPSAALQSLRSARFLTSVNDVSYPAAIASPNPALNTAAPMGKFRYDKDFLLQFQRVFVEKPSETWIDKVKETVGDTSTPDSSTRVPISAKTPMMGQRQPSNRPNLSQPFAMGTFGAPGGGRTLPPGTTSQSRYEASTSGQGAVQRPSMQNPLAPFVRPGGFQMGMSKTMDRSPSSTSISSHPQSPRGNQSHRGGGGGGRGSKGGKPSRDNDKDAKQMPLTAGADLKPIQTTASGWKPRSVGANATGMAGPAPGGDGHVAPDVVQRKVKSNLNKMTPNNFDKISFQILDIAGQSKDETDGRTLRQVIQLTFEKATDEAHWAQMYAEFCKRMLESMSPEIKDESILDKSGNVVVGGALFRKYLLNRCQEEFERGWKMNLPDKPEGESKEEVMLSDEYYIAAAAKRRGLGLVRFIGELYKLGMLTERIMHECVKKLVDYDGIPDEAEVESLTSLLKTIGQNLDSTDRGLGLMDAYFSRINGMMETKGLPSRLKFMLMDILDLRRKRWQTKGGVLKGPTTLDEVRQQAVAAEREKEVQRAQDNSRRGGGGGGGGGRMPMGRGDARNFSGGGQYGMQAPPDFQKNTVGMDDLRRLGSKTGSRQASSQGPVFGPTSMFSARGSNNRKTMGSGGMARGGEDSGASSRTATPPAQKEKKEKEETKSANAFSALAGLDASGEPTDPASPPSVHSSPPTTKSQPLSDQQRSKSPLGKEKEDQNEAAVS